MLQELTVPALKAMAKAEGLTGYSKLTKAELIERLERAMGKAPKSTIVKEIAKEQNVPVIDTPMTMVSDWEDMKDAPVSEDSVRLTSVESLRYKNKPPRQRCVNIEASPKSSDELWDEATSITEEVLEQPKGSMRVMNRHARRRAEAKLRKLRKKFDKRSIA